MNNRTTLEAAAVGKSEIDLKSLYTPPIKKMHFPSRNPFYNGTIIDYMEKPNTKPLNQRLRQPQRFMDDMIDSTNLLSPPAREKNSTTTSVGGNASTRNMSSLHNLEN